MRGCVVDVAEEDVNRHPDIVHCLNVLLEFDNSLGELIRPLIYVVPYLNLAVKVVPVAIHQQNDILYRAFLNQVLKILDQPSLGIPDIVNSLNTDRSNAMLAGLLCLLLPLLNDESLDVSFGKESLPDILRNIELSRGPLGCLVFDLPAIFIKM